MNNPRFTDEGTIPLIQENEDYDVYGTANTSRVDETSFTIEPATTEVTSTLRLKVH